MPLLLAALAAAGAVALLAAAGRPPLDRLPPALVRRTAVALVAFLPLVYAALLLAGAAPRLGAVRVDYVGKQLAFASGLPVTVGGSDPAGDVEDLHVRRLPPAALAVRPADGGRLELALGDPAPAVEVDGELLNEVPLEEGDVIEIDGGEGDQPLRLTFTGGGLAAGDAEVELPNRFLFRLRGDDRAVFLQDVVRELAPRSPAAPWSFLRLPGVTAGWRLVLREPGVRVVAADGEAGEGGDGADGAAGGSGQGEAGAGTAAGAAAGGGEDGSGGGEAGGEPPPTVIRGLDPVAPGAFQPRFEVPSPARVRLAVVWGQPGRRTLSWARDDRLERRDDVVEVRFARPLRYLAEIDPETPAAARRHLAVVVPGTFERHEMIELDEPSARFRGTSALLDLPADGAPRLRFLGAERALTFGEVYGLGEGDDLLFLRFVREELPWPLLLDLALLGLFVVVFLGPSLGAEPGLAAVTAPVGLLLANRLLFAWKAAHRPPAYAVEALAEARLAVWLVAALVVAGWALAWALGRPAGSLGPRAVRWPVGGLVLAALGCWLVGSGGGRWLALVPLVLAALLAALPALLARRRVGERAAAWRRGGIPWRLSWLLAAGAAILAARLLFAAVGMPEALRIPGGGRLLLWTVVHLPLAAALLALSIVIVRRRVAGERLAVGERTAWERLTAGGGAAPSAPAARTAGSGGAAAHSAEHGGALPSAGGEGAGAPVPGAAPEAERDAGATAGADAAPPSVDRLAGGGMPPGRAAAAGDTAGTAAELTPPPPAARPRHAAWSARWHRLESRLASPPLAVLALLAFLGLAFAAVAVAVGDLGLLLVQALPFAVALLLVADWPAGQPLVSPRGLAAAAAVALAALPVAGVVLVNASPETAVALATPGGGAIEPGAEPVRDRAAALSAQRAQQLFRLYLLANPDVLSEVGLEPSDRVAVQYHTLQDYAEGAGWGGGGFLSAPVPRHLGATYLSDLVPMVFVLPELGKAGLLGLGLLYALPLAWLAFALWRRGGGEAGGSPLAEQGTALAAVAFLVFAVPGLYMILANLNLVLFSGKNAPLLGLNSLSDALESGLVLALAAAGLGLRRAAR